jgi:hypothetical protein
MIMLFFYRPKLDAAKICDGKPRAGNQAERRRGFDCKFTAAAVCPGAS